MTAVPLLCRICPQEPDFSDLSHLLTHVSSKGHLSHYLKAQLRARIDNDIRAKIDAYDVWYERYQIERLLSQRMSVKASKGGPPKPRKAPVRTRRPARLRGKRDKTSPSLPPWASPSKTEDAIDPQLSHQAASPMRGSDQGTEQSREDIEITPSLSRSRSYKRHLQDADVGMNILAHSDINESLQYAIGHSGRQADPRKEPQYRTLKEIYPDPSTLSLSNPVLQRSPPVAEPFTGRQQQRPGSLAKHGTEPNAVSSESIASPVLKGIKWPGMSLFDSADLGAQRLRNQKKDGAVIEQMQQNSAFVEQMEDIFWPDGTLKKRRFITGNVDSSPASQPSPPPKRRRKTQRPRKALADLSTNAPLVRRRAKDREEAHLLGHTVDRRDNLQKEPTVLAELSTNQPFDHGLGIRAQQSRMGMPARLPPQRSFKVFNDGRPMSSVNSRNSTNPHRTTGLEHTKSEKPSSVDTASRLLFSPFGDNPASQPEGRSVDLRIPHLQENGGSHLQRDDSESNPTTNPYAQAPRDTQRYFSATINEAPQFFSSLPPHMDLFGMAAPTYRGATLNPLNPQFRHTRQAPQTVYVPPPFSMSTSH